VPAVLVLCVFGTFAINSSMFDVVVMFAVGALGYLMLVLAIPAAPLLIGFILGPLLEDKFRQSMLMSGGAPEIFVRGPITCTFWVLTALAPFFIIANIRRSWRTPGP
jgi:putative tricarboxylic transport membrane protein